MRLIVAAAVLVALALPAGAAEDDPHGRQWHFMDHSADMRLVIRPWCVPNTPQRASCSHGVSTPAAGPRMGWRRPY
jgi:hypothetical protein